MSEKRRVVYSGGHDDLRRDEGYFRPLFLNAKSPLDLDIEQAVESLLAREREIAQSDSPTEYILGVLSDDFDPNTSFRWNYQGEIWSWHVSEDGKGINFYRRDEGGEEILEASFDTQEIKAYFSKFRDRVQDRFRAKGVDNWHVLGKQLGRAVHHLHADYVVREAERGFESRFRRSQNNKEALYALPEKSPYIFYPQTIRAENKAIVLERKRDFSTLIKLIQEKRVTAPEALCIYRDFLLAQDFIIKHDFRCTDLDLSNIGVDARTGQGFAFDFDGLVRANQDEFYMAKLSHYPPERRVGRERDEGDFYGEPIVYPDGFHQDEVTTAEMVYELGMALLQLANEVPFDSIEQQDLVLDLSREMRRRKPAERPRLIAVIDRIEKIIQIIAPAKTVPENVSPVQARFEQMIKAFDIREDQHSSSKNTRVGNPFDIDPEKGADFYLVTQVGNPFHPDASV